LFSRYLVIALALGAAVFRASQGAWIESIGLFGLGGGLVALKLSATRPRLRPFAYAGFSSPRSRSARSSTATTFPACEGRARADRRGAGALVARPALAQMQHDMSAMSPGWTWTATGQAF
jgi:hypothetical protein